jgi:hypothetical protein
MTAHADSPMGAPPGPGPGPVARNGRRGRGEQPMVPEAEFRSYYGRPILQRPHWKAHNIAGYFFLGGLAAGSSLLAEIGVVTRRPSLRRVGRLAAVAAMGVSAALLVADLGRPSRFANMLRVFRPTSPMNVGSWLLSVYGPLTGVAALGELFSESADRRRGRRASRLAGLGAAALAPGVASYTALVLSDTAVPVWHDAYRELPFVFVGSAASAAAGLGLMLVPVEEAGPAAFLGVLGNALGLAAEARMIARLGIGDDALRKNRARALMRPGEILGVSGSVGAALLARRSRSAAFVSGLAMLAGSAGIKFGIFNAGVISAEDPRFTVVPQRARLLAG